MKQTDKNTDRGPTLQPPDLAGRKTDGNKSPHGRLFILTGLLFLLFLAVMVVFVLPEMADKTTVADSDEKISRSAEPAALETAQPEQPLPEELPRIAAPPISADTPENVVADDKNQQKTAIDPAESAFQQAVGQTMAALAQGEFSQARTALGRAKAIKGSDPVISDLTEQIKNKELAARLLALRKKSEKAKDRENWQQALNFCEQAMQLESDVAFALSCREQAVHRLELDRRLEAILQQPEKIFTAKALAAARKLQTHVQAIDQAGPRLSNQLSRLTALIRLAETEVEITLYSDGMSDIVIYHVGRFGRFTEKKLRLRTGNYTVVASRQGYRDARQLLKIRPEGQHDFTVCCEEKI
jgi:hypothetical protein